MSDEAEIAGLIERLEAATGPDRELDCLIFEDRRDDLSPSMRGMYYGEPTGEYFHLNGEISRAPAYTASIDAAMTLVPEGMHISIVGPAGKTHSARVGDEVGLALSFPLALCSAALRARAHILEHPNAD